MRKGFRKILAVVLCLVVFISVSPLTMAAFEKNEFVKASDDYGYNFKGVIRVKLSGTKTIEYPRDLKQAQGKGFEIENSSVCVAGDAEESNKIVITGVGYGATVLSFYSYNVVEEYDEEYGDTWEYEDYVDVINYAIVTYDDEDERLTGKVTGVSVPDMKVKCEDTVYVEPDFKTQGDVYVYTILYTQDENGIVAFYDDESIITWDRGTAQFICYAIDTNGNIVSDTFTVTSRMTPWQWIVKIFYMIRDFIFGGSFF